MDKGKMILVLVVFILNSSKGQGTNAKLDSKNSGEIRFECAGFQCDDTTIVHINEPKLYAEEFRLVPLNHYYLWYKRVPKGHYTISISSLHKPFHSKETFELKSDLENVEGDTTWSFCNSIWLNYVPTHPIVENYRQKTIDKEYATKVKQWDLNDKGLQKKLKKDIEDTFEDVHGKDLDYVGETEHYLITIHRCKRPAKKITQ